MATLGTKEPSSWQNTGVFGGMQPLKCPTSPTTWSRRAHAGHTRSRPAAEACAERQVQRLPRCAPMPDWS
eukprot:11208998-Lingulodinium_polyedra.AAC.1